MGSQGRATRTRSLESVLPYLWCRTNYATTTSKVREHTCAGCVVAVGAAAGGTAGALVVPGTGGGVTATGEVGGATGAAGEAGCRVGVGSSTGGVATTG